MRLIRSIIIASALGWLFAVALIPPAVGQKTPAKDDAKQAEDRTTNLKIVITGGDKDEPVAQASVYIRFQQDSALHFLTRKHKKIELDLKTDQKGIASFPELPQGKVLIQVVASGWTTFGQYYELNQDRQTIPIKLAKPKTHWY